MDTPGAPPAFKELASKLPGMDEAMKKASDPAVQEARKDRQREEFARGLMGGDQAAPAALGMQPLQYQRPQVPQMAPGGPPPQASMMMAQQAPMGGPPPVAAPMEMPPAGGMAPTRMVADRLNASPMGMQAPWAGLLAPGQRPAYGRR